MQKLNINVSHDNDVDCGPYPGDDGAVSWYDAFKDRKRGRRYKHVIHLVRDPLKTINSRIHKCKTRPQIQFLKHEVMDYEKVSENETCFSFSIKNWVRRNSFVSLHASWAVKSESFFTESLSVWELCMAASLGPRCPALTTIAPVMESIPFTLNSNYQGAVLSKSNLQNNITFEQDAIFYSWESWHTRSERTITNTFKLHRRWHILMAIQCLQALLHLVTIVNLLKKMEMWTNIGTATTFQTIGVHSVTALIIHWTKLICHTASKVIYFLFNWIIFLSILTDLPMRAGQFTHVICVKEARRSQQAGYAKYAPQNKFAKQ